MKLPTRNVWFDSLPKYGYYTLENVGSNRVYVWNGHRRGTGRERAVVCWCSRTAQKAIKELDRLVAKTSLRTR